MSASRNPRSRAVQEGPRWRWSSAEQILLSEKEGLSSEGPEDYYVNLACRVGRLVNHRVGRRWVRSKWPISWDVYWLGCHTQTMKTSRASIECCLIAGLTPKQTAEKLLWLSPMHVQLYSKWFFDTEGVNHVQSWLEDHVLVRYKQSTNFDNNMIALILAFDGKIDDALTYLLTGRAPEHSMYKTLRKNERSKLMSNYIMRGVHLPEALAAPLLETAVKQEDDVDRMQEQTLVNAGISLSEADISKLEEATAKYADVDAHKYSTGPDGIEDLPGMESVRERLIHTQEKVDE